MSEIIDEHRAYICDSIRLNRYKAAIDRTVRPGDIVADLGCGFGVLGLLCLQAGATRVFGVDATRALEIARETIQRAGLADRYVCLSGLTSQTDLPERVDVAICDHVGYLGFDYGVVDLMRDARRRFLKPGGRLIPSRLVLQLAVVESPSCRAKTAAWTGDAAPAEYRWLREYDVNAKHPVMLSPDDLICKPAALGAIELGVEGGDAFSFDAQFRVTREGVVDGLAGWFDCELAKGVFMTNSPLAQDAIEREQAFLPISEPLPVSAGEVLKATLAARPADSIVSWTLEAPASGRRFAHSTWRGLILSKEDIARSHSDAAPRLTRAGRARQIVLNQCDGVRTIREIEQALLRDHPRLFPTREEISRFIHETLRRDAE